MRQAKLAQLLALDGHTVHTYALEQDRSTGPLPEEDLSQAEKADCVVLPLLVSTEGRPSQRPSIPNRSSLVRRIRCTSPQPVYLRRPLDSEILALAAHRGLTSACTDCP